MITNFEIFEKSRLIEGVVTPKTYIENEIDRLIDKGIKNLTPKEKEFLKNPYKPDEEEKPN